MLVTLHNQTRQIENSASGLANFFGELSGWLEENKLHVNLMRIDGQEIYADFEEYITEHLSSVQHVEVDVVTLDEYAAELIDSAREYCAQAVNLLPGLSAAYYQSPTTDTWEQFQEFLEGAAWLIKLTELLRELAPTGASTVGLTETGEALGGVLTELLEAVERQQFTEVGDLLQYEVLPRFEQLQDVLGQSDAADGAGQ